MQTKTFYEDTESFWGLITIDKVYIQHPALMGTSLTNNLIFLLKQAGLNIPLKKHFLTVRILKWTFPGLWELVKRMHG